MAAEFSFGGEVVWRPTPEMQAASHLQQFITRHGLADFAALLARSTSDVSWFTDAVLQYLDIRFDKPYTQVLDLSRGPAWPRWCVGGQLNIVTNCLDKYQANAALATRPAILWESEAGQTGQLSYAALYRQVNQVANLLRRLGLGQGDTIGLFMPMTPEIVVALLAIARIGGVALPLFSGYGASAVTTRLADGQAKALFTADGLLRRGQLVPLKPTADEALRDVPTLRHVIVVRRAGNPVAMQPGRDWWWDEHVPDEPETAPAAATGAEDPLMILYTSGTTGRPKGALHTHCGFPVKAAQDMAFGTDVHAGDRMFWLTDMGWMMGPWLVFGTLLLGASMFLYDGAPDWSASATTPGLDPGRLWAMVERHQLTHLGISPTLVRALIPHGAEPVKRHSLASLRILASTGEPWNPAPWHWLFETVCERRRPIINYSGGTELSGGIVMSNPLLPIKPCAFAAACPGMAADVVNEAGESVRNQVGELVIRAPWIGMTRGFWRDPQRYEETYWSRFPGMWVHGDFAAIDAEGMWYILGRSDDTIKVAGKRLGPAEVESLLVADPRLLEAAAIGVPDELKGNHIVCFCVLRAGVQPDEALRQALIQRVVDGLGKALKPREVWFVTDLPKTRNAKVMRRIIRAAYLEQPLGDVSSLENPGAISAIRQGR